MSPSTSKSEKRQVRNLHALLDVSKAMAAEVHLDDLLQVIIHKTTEVMDAERSSLFIYDEPSNELWSKVAEDLELKEIRFPIGVGIAGDVAKTRQVANIPDAYKDPRFNPRFDKQTNYHTRSILCMPIINNKDQLVGVIQVLNKRGKTLFDREDEALLQALAAHAAVALERAQLIEAYVEKQKIQEALKLAHDIQMGLLPKEFPPFPDMNQFEIFASIKPAKEVGGDFYDFFLVDGDHLCFAIGDVSGKGIPAALFMAVTKTLVKGGTVQDASPDDILFRVNNELCRENDSGMFVTIFLGVLNIQTGKLLFSNGGHNPPYILHSNGSVSTLKSSGGIALGVMEDFEFGLDEITLGKEEGIYLYTDGVNEAMDQHGKEFSSERLESFLRSTSTSSVTDITIRTIDAVDDFIAGAPQSDDITVMAVRYLL